MVAKAAVANRSAQPLKAPEQDDVQLDDQLEDGSDAGEGDEAADAMME